MSTQKIQEALSLAEKTLKDALRTFRAESRATQDKASKAINIFGTTVTSEVSDIIADSRRLCDKLYATCQTQVTMLDEACRPLLDDSIPIELVEKVWKMISQLNEESEIKSNFTASFDSTSLGDFATVQYHPTMENKMIESFWKSKYEGWNGREKYERDIQEAKEKEERAKKERAAQRKSSDEANYEEELESWEKKTAEVESKRKAAIEKREAKKREDTLKKIEADLAAAIEKNEATKKECSEKLKKIEGYVAKLPFYQVMKKKRANEAIAELKASISDAEQALASAQKKHDEDLKQINGIINGLMKGEIKKINKSYPLPRKPRKPLSMRISNPTPSDMVNEAMKLDLIKLLEKHGELTVFEIQEKDSTFNDFTGQRIINWLNQLMREGEVVRNEKRKDGSTAYVYSLT